MSNISPPITGSVIIDPGYFDRAVNDYSELGWALPRELMQNGGDAKGTKKVSMHHYFDPDFNSWVLDCSNDGEPMDHTVLFEKFLRLGGSGKDFVGGAVGGFGRAKELYFCQKSWVIETGEFRVAGKGGNFQHTTGHRFEGTRSIIQLGDQFNTLDFHIRKMCSLMDWSGQFVYTSLNGETEVLQTNLKCGKEQCEYPWGKVYTQNHPLLNGVCVVRVKGIPMFWRHHSGEELVIVEIQVHSSLALVSNRDSFKWPYWSEFDTFLTNLSMCSTSAFRTKWEIKEYSGDSIKVRVRKNAIENKAEENVEESVVNSPASMTTTQLLMSSSMAARVVQEPSEQGAPHQANFTLDELVDGLVPHYREAAKDRDNESITVVSSNIPHKIGHRFYTANNTGTPIPDWFTPTKMGHYCVQVATKWIEALVLIHGIMEVEGDFNVGFVFAERHEALYDPKIRCYYLNPVRLVKQAGSQSYAFKKRFNPHTDHFDIVADAAHEFLHANGYLHHDEGYANALTRMTALLLKNYKAIKS